MITLEALAHQRAGASEALAHLVSRSGRGSPQNSELVAQGEILELEICSRSRSEDPLKTHLSSDKNI